MSKHTPGTWKSEISESEAHYREHPVYGPDSQLIAIVDSGNYGGWRDSEDDGQAEFAANARLIAAAPDLLEALEEIYCHGVQAFGTDFEVMLTARDAIARAKGERP